MTKFVKQFIVYYPEAWLDLIDAVIWIITLAQWKPNWGFKYMIWYTKRKVKR
jgi:hypothetical protein